MDQKQLETEEDFVTRVFQDAEENATQKEAAPQEEQLEGARGEELKEPDQPQQVDQVQEELRRLREERDLADRRARDLEHRLKSDAGRVAALQRQIDAAKTASTKAAPGPRLDSIKDEYPDLAEVIQSELAAREAEQSEKIRLLEDRLAGVAAPLEQVMEERQTSLVKDTYSAMEKRVPGWRNEVTTDAFKAWTSSQPKGVRAMLESDDISDAAFVIELYRKSLPSKPDKQQIIDRVAMPNGKSTNSSDLDDEAFIARVFNGGRR